MPYYIREAFFMVDTNEGERSARLAVDAARGNMDNLQRIARSVGVVTNATGQEPVAVRANKSFHENGMRVTSDVVLPSEKGGSIGITTKETLDDNDRAGAVRAAAYVFDPKVTTSSFGEAKGLVGAASIVSVPGEGTDASGAVEGRPALRYQSLAETVAENLHVATMEGLPSPTTEASAKSDAVPAQSTNNDAKTPRSLPSPR
jgi:hypothetical protein